MRRCRIIAALLIGLAPATSSWSWAEPTSASSAVNNWAEFRAVLASCWMVPKDTKGSLIALRFGLNKTGNLRGPPLVTARQLKGEQDAQKRFEDAALDALTRCLPMRVTPAFGAILGESPIRLRFANTPATAAYQLNSNITIFAPR
jgi:hypothetical protein